MLQSAIKAAHTGSGVRSIWSRIATSRRWLHDSETDAIVKKLRATGQAQLLVTALDQIANLLCHKMLG